MIKTIVTFLLVATANVCMAQELPELLKFNNGPQFSYMDCLHNLTKKKDRYCDRHDYTFSLEQDTLYVTYTWNYKVDKGRDAKQHQYYYKVAIKDINFSKTLENIPYEGRPKIKNMEGETKTVCGFKVFTYRDKLIANEPKWGERVTERRSEVFLNANYSFDAKALIEYLQKQVK